MFSYKSKMHYEKVLGPSKLFSPRDDEDDCTPVKQSSEYDEYRQVLLQQSISNNPAMKLESQMSSPSKDHPLLESR